MMVLDALRNIGNGSESQMIGSIENLGYCTRSIHPDLFSLVIDPSIEISKFCKVLQTLLSTGRQPGQQANEKTKLALETVEQEPVCAVQIWPPNCIVPLQLAQVQVSAKLLDILSVDRQGLGIVFC